MLSQIEHGNKRIKAQLAGLEINVSKLEIAMEANMHTPKDIDTVLLERNSTHGDFNSQAVTAQELKGITACTATVLTDVQKEALDMICVKVSRIVKGNPNEANHWQAIIGYATLALQSLET